jgi:hypothetical protein
VDNNRFEQVQTLNYNCLVTADLVMLDSTNSLCQESRSALSCTWSIRTPVLYNRIRQPTVQLCRTGVCMFSTTPSVADKTPSYRYVIQVYAPYSTRFNRTLLRVQLYRTVPCKVQGIAALGAVGTEVLHRLPLLSSGSGLGPERRMQ